MAWFQSGGCRLHWESAGSGPLLVLLHNGFYSSETWTPLTGRLAASFTCVSWDRWGYGKSARGMAMRATIDDGVEELGDLLDHLESCGIDTARVLVCGHCMGGAIAARWVARNPGRCAALVLESTGFFSDPSLRRKADIIIQPWDRLPESLRKTLIGMHGPLKAPEVWNFILAWEDDYIMHPAYDLRPDLAAIDCPVLVATGERDVYFKPEHTRHGHAVLAGRGALAAGHADRCGPGAELWIPEGIGHDLHHELPDEFAGRLAGFLGA